MFQCPAPACAKPLLVAVFLCKTKKLLYHSVLKLFTGFAIAAFIAWKLIVASAIIIATSPPAANNHQLMLMR
jgi:hypothetical protein